jgi:hypothetical protein
MKQHDPQFSWRFGRQAYRGRTRIFEPLRSAPRPVAGQTCFHFPLASEMEASEDDQDNGLSRRIPDPGKSVPDDC